MFSKSELFKELTEWDAFTFSHSNGGKYLPVTFTPLRLLKLDITLPSTSSHSV